ncbi:hypothetical protein HQ489_02645 [Candidatus Woesearchaeota archaeon]|nr:hypothetical protein [Candidatus Woesearchaeota archaeon]
MDFKALMDSANQKLNNFGTLSLGEQISYSTFVLGFVLVIVSVVLFVL